MRALRQLALLVALALLSANPASALQPDELLADPKLESRARALSSELRCLVCQNQSIDDSDAPLAKDLRAIVRERLKAGDSDEAIRRYLVERYGAFVLLKPPFDASTLLLWLTPGLVLLIGAAGLVIAMRRRRVTAEPAPLAPEEQARLRALLDDTTPTGEKAG